MSYFVFFVSYLDFVYFARLNICLYLNIVLPIVVSYILSYYLIMFRILFYFVLIFYFVVSYLIGLKAQVKAQFLAQIRPKFGLKQPGTAHKPRPSTSQQADQASQLAPGPACMACSSLFSFANGLPSPAWPVHLLSPSHAICTRSLAR